MDFFKKWMQEFWHEHGVRLFFGGIALVFALFFIFQTSEQLKGSGTTIMIGLAMIAFNKARGNGKNPIESPPAGGDEPKE